MPLVVAPWLDEPSSQNAFYRASDPIRWGDREGRGDREHGPVEHGRSGAGVVWSPPGLTLSAGGRPAYAMSAMGSAVQPGCPVKVGLRARGTRVAGATADGSFAEGVEAHLRKIVEALAARRGRGHDAALSAARLTYQHNEVLSLFLAEAAEHYLDFLDGHEGTVGPLTYTGYLTSAVVTKDFDAKVWAPVYRRQDGSAEVHRLRRARAKGELDGWATGAAWVVSRDLGVAVSVVEVGLEDGMDHALIDMATSEDLMTPFGAMVLPVLRSLHDDDVPVPGRDCGDCAAVARCPAVIPVDMFEGQRDSNPWVRSLSVSDLKLHARCPRQWRLRDLRLPAQPSSNESLERGRLVHEAIAASHTIGGDCDPTEGDAGLDEQGVRMLGAHTDLCDRDGLETVALEQTLVLFDARARIVLYMKPDEVCRRGATLVIRETKTTAKTHLVEDRTAARDEYHDVLGWALAALNGGLLEFYGAERGRVELEVLTGSGGATHVFASDGVEADLLVGAWLEGAPAQWLMDTTWPTRPGPACASCAYRAWCPDVQDPS